MPEFSANEHLDHIPHVSPADAAHAAWVVAGKHADREEPTPLQPTAPAPLGLKAGLALELGPRKGRRRGRLRKPL